LAEAHRLRQHAAMKKFAVKIAVNAIGLYLASLVIPHQGVTFAGEGFQRAWTVLIVALIFGLVNTFVRPIVKLFSFPLMLLTLGLLTFVINALMLMLTSKISEHFAVRFQVKDFLAALFASLIVTAVSLVAHAVLPDDVK
jgi:putative membrane protein